MLKRIAIDLGVIALVGLAIVVVLNLTSPSANFAPINGPLMRSFDDGYATGGGAMPQAIAPAEASFAYEESRQAEADTATANNAAGQDRMVIQNADLSIVVKDPAVKMQAVSALAKTLGGFVVSSNIYEAFAENGVKAPQASLVVRIPAEKLDEALQQIKADAIEVQSETRSGQDVTSEYTDLASQLKNLLATEEQLTEIMQKAELTEDVLAVFNQLTQIRSQIEIIKGQMQYYEQSAALSAVTVRLIAEQTIQPIEIAGWKPDGVARDAIQALVNFFQDFVDFLIWFVLFLLPALLLVLLPVFLIFLAVRAFMRRNQAKKAAGG